MKYEILEALRGTKKRLTTARNLSDYHAIIVDPCFGALIDGAVDVPPGEGYSPREERWISQYQKELNERSRQLESFFRADGTLVVRVVEESIQWVRAAPGMYGSSTTRTVSSHEWFEQWIHDGYQGFRESGQGQIVLPGYGQPVELREPGHAFASYLLHRNGYAARLNSAFLSYPRATVLATNRGGEPVAIEVTIGRGSIVLVPPPLDAEDERLLREATERVVHARIGVGRDWIVEPEATLQTERKTVEERHAVERRDLEERMDAILVAKQRVLDEPEVRRAIGYYEKASRAGSPRAGLPELYNLVEMLKGYYRCGDDEVARRIGVPASTIEAIKRPQNQKQYDIRHATVGSPEPLPAKEIADAMVAGQDTVRAFIETRFRAITAVHEGAEASTRSGNQG